MHSYKIGDRVKVISKTYEPTVTSRFGDGEEGAISELGISSDDVVRLGERPRGWVSIHDIELVHDEIFKVGDKVRLKEGLKVRKTYGGDLLLPRMLSLKGRELTISRVLSRKGFYHLKEDTNKPPYNYTGEMLERVGSRQGQATAKRPEIKAGYVVEIEEPLNTRLFSVHQCQEGFVFLDRFDRHIFDFNGDFDENLEHHSPELSREYFCRITKIYGYAKNGDEVFNLEGDRPLLWERKELPKRTKEELEKELGYEFELVEETAKTIE